ncbi:MAG TPA: sugar transferase, partial [Chromatiaceae bacterium]|nr:sugar transferase [Chromatiaceae bacterium]
MDLVDVDSDKWRQYARKTGWPMRWIYQREAERLLRFERRSARTFDVVYLVSEAEAELFRTLAPETAGHVFALYNGVDLDFFKPDAEYSNPYSEAGPHVVFTGAMDYWPNVDAVVWFVENVLPGLRNDHPGVMFHIVGARPTEKVQKLG